MFGRASRPIDKIVIHCSATPPESDIGVAEIRRMHVSERGFSDIGYHYVIRRNGAVELGRPLESVGAHAEGYNAKSIGVCLVGGVIKKHKKWAPINNFSKDQFNTLRIMVQEFRKLYPEAEILGHRDLPGVKKDCPSFDVKEWLDTWD